VEDLSVVTTITRNTATRHQHEINEGARGAGLVVNARASWSVLAPATPATRRRDFNPERAGRRAVDKHGEALRRLAD
jgi:hypothetical protein